MALEKQTTKIKDTGLGKWLKSKAPNVLNVVGDLLPDSGGLGIVKNLIDKDPDVNTDEGVAAVDAEIQFQNNVTERWKADMGSDVKLAKLIRPVTLIALMSMFMVTMFIDSMDNVAFNVKDSYVDLLQVLMLTAFGAYFAGRTIEKAKK
jgi:hypothetical protein|tara:strand:+ start:1140 stop:1586 length:447 start_codon:yes stop_codon:yes gene_type:complete